MFKNKKEKIHVRQARESDIAEIMRIEEKVWPAEMRATKDMFISRIRTFPDGFLCAVKGKTIQGFVCSEIIKYKDTKKRGFDWYSLSDNGSITKSHNPRGDSLYGISLSVLPQTNIRVMSKIIEGLGKLIIRKRLKRTVFGARMPKYHKYATKLTPREYILTRRRKGFLLDPELSLYLSLGIYPVRIIKDYFNDEYSLNYGVLVTWKNPYYKLIKLYPFLASALSNLWRIKIFKPYEVFKVGKKGLKLAFEEEKTE